MAPSRDLSDRGTINAFAKTVQTIERLRLLLVIAQSDDVRAKSLLANALGVALRRMDMLPTTLKAMGVDEKRVRLQWASAAEGPQLAEAVDEMAQQIVELGPLNWPGNWKDESGQQEAVGCLLGGQAFPLVG